MHAQQINKQVCIEEGLIRMLAWHADPDRTTRESRAKRGMRIRAPKNTKATRLDTSTHNTKCHVSLVCHEHADMGIRPSKCLSRCTLSWPVGWPLQHRCSFSSRCIFFWDAVAFHSFAIFVIWVYNPIDKWPKTKWSVSYIHICDLTNTIASGASMPISSIQLECKRSRHTTTSCWQHVSWAVSWSRKFVRDKLYNVLQAVARLVSKQIKFCRVLLNRYIVFCWPRSFWYLAHLQQFENA
jgi:hypothetical protein